MRSSKEVTFELLVLALFLLVVEVGARRLHLDEERRDRLRRWLGSRLPMPGELLPAGGPREMGVPSGLKARSQAVRSRLRPPGGMAPGGVFSSESMESKKAASTSERRGEDSGSTTASPESAGDTLGTLRAKRHRTGRAGAESHLPSDLPGPGRISPDSGEDGEAKSGKAVPERGASTEPGDGSSKTEATTSRLLDAKRRRRGQKGT